MVARRRGDARARARREQRAWRARGRGSAEVVGEAGAGPRQRRGSSEARGRSRRASLVARMRGDARARARREQRAWRARREQRARVQGGRVGARARQRRGRSREEFPVRTFVLSSSRSQISVTLLLLFQNIHNIKMRSTFVPRRPSFFVRHIRCSPPLPRVCVVACARRKPHHQNSLQSC